MKTLEFCYDEDKFRDDGIAVRFRDYDKKKGSSVFISHNDLENVKIGRKELLGHVFFTIFNNLMKEGYGSLTENDQKLIDLLVGPEEVSLL